MPVPSAFRVKVAGKAPSGVFISTFQTPTAGGVEAAQPTNTSKVTANHPFNIFFITFKPFLISDTENYNESLESPD